VSVLTLAAAVMLLSGCASTTQRPLIYRTDGPQVQEPAVQKSSRTLASLELTKQGRALLEQGRPDDAISALERSLGIDPTNGQSYYYLAEAWLLKGNVTQAREFNRLAGLYLKDDHAWAVRVLNQESRISQARSQP
jgi:predicted Zn-dependent protease